MSVCLTVRMNAEISETINAGMLGLTKQTIGVFEQRNFVSAKCHARDLLTLFEKFHPDSLKTKINAHKRLEQ